MLNKNLKVHTVFLSCSYLCKKKRDGLSTHIFLYSLTISRKLHEIGTVLYPETYPLLLLEIFIMLSYSL